MLVGRAFRSTADEECGTAGGKRKKFKRVMPQRGCRCLLGPGERGIEYRKIVFQAPPTREISKPSKEEGGIHSGTKGTR